MPWRPAKEAAKALGIGERTLRTRAQLGQVQTKPHPEYPRWRLYLVEGKESSGERKDSSEQEKPPAQETPAADGLDELAALLGKPAPEPAPAPRKTDERVWRVAGIWDCHVPDHDTLAFEAVLRWLRDHQPDELIIGGDFLELESCSQHGGVASPRRLVDECKGGRKYLGRLREALPSAKIVYLGGNHEYRLERITVAHLPTFEGALTVERLLDLESLRIGWVPYKRLYQPQHPSGALSKLRYTHGVFANKYHAFKHLDRYGVPLRYGHVHTSQIHLRGRGDGHVFGAWATPCLRTLEPSWLEGPSDWVHGFSYDEILPDGGFTAHTIVMADRRFAWGGRVYGGRL